ncbi:MAG: adenylate/guanylate cyclase domain-containing protein [Acidobacteriota bacterium]
MSAMPGKLQPTLKQLFAFSLTGLALGLALLFYLFRDGSERTILQSSQRFRDSASREVADRVKDYLSQAPMAVMRFEDQIRYGVVRPPDPDSIEMGLLLVLVCNENISEATFTYGESQGFDKQGHIRLDPATTGQVTVLRSEKGAIERRYVRYRNRQFYSESQKLDPQHPTPRSLPVRVADPTAHPTFQTPASRDQYGTLLWSDLHFSQLDEDLPEDRRRVEVSVQQVIDDIDSDFAGVLRVGLMTSKLDGAIRVHLTEAGSDDPHQTFLCDRQGRLITGFGKQVLMLSGDDLRVPPASVPPQIAAALKTPELQTIDHDRPLAAATYQAGGKEYLATFRAMPPGQTQDWIAGIVVPSSFYLAPLLRIQHTMMAVVSALMIAILAAGIFMLRRIGSAHSLIVHETGQMKLFNFTPSLCSSPLRDVEDVLAGLEKAKTAMRAMGKYVPVDLVRRLYRDGKEPVLGAELTELSVLFTDIKGFTSIAENMEPGRLAMVLGRYLQVIAGVVQSEKGTVDKYIGDSVMAFWNAPEPVTDHAIFACRAALRSRNALLALYESAEWKSEPVFETRFGLHLSTVSVGHFGAPDRFNYTAIGDGINVASRLEGLNKYYGTSIIVSDSVHAAAEHEFEFRLLDNVSVKGKTEGLLVYELLDYRQAGRQRPEYIARYEQAWTMYREGQFAEALELLARQTYDGPSVQLAERCRRYILEGPPSAWGGVHAFDTK